MPDEKNNFSQNGPSKERIREDDGLEYNYMIDFLKYIFRIITRTPDPSKFQTRVALNYTFYKCEYYDGLSWKPIYKPITFHDDLRMDHKFHPYLGSFNECVQFCQGFKALQDIDNYHERVFSKWDAIYNEQKLRKDAARNKTWHSKKP